MRSPWLVGSRDSLFAAELFPRHGTLYAAFPATLPAWHVYRYRGSSAVFVCRFPFSEAEASDCTFKAGKNTCLHGVRYNTGGGMVSGRLVTSASVSISSMEAANEDCDSDEEFDKEFARYRGLVLDLAYRPINVVCWRRALCLEILEKADVLEYYDQVISSPSRPFAIPAVLRIADYTHSPVHAKVKLSLNRNNLFLRDKFRCQYCGSQDKLTVDHVVPVSRGGEWTWRNLVTACSKCNARKSNKTMEEAKMQLLKTPKEPRALDGQNLPSSYAAFRSLQNTRKMPTEWVGYLPKRFQPMDYF